MMEKYVTSCVINCSPNIFHYRARPLELASCNNYDDFYIMRAQKNNMLRVLSIMV